jgi:hypothetical protein
MALCQGEDCAGRYPQQAKLDVAADPCPSAADHCGISSNSSSCMDYQGPSCTVGCQHHTCSAAAHDEAVILPADGAALVGHIVDQQLVNHAAIADCNLSMDLFI